jgi:hypothetical protein
MSYEPKDYWAECILDTAAEIGLDISKEQLDHLAEAIRISHENYGMAFYSPPSSDRLHSIENEWKAKYDRLQAEFDKYRGNAETAVKQALRQYSDANVSIGEYGEVFRHSGRTEQIQ